MGETSEQAVDRIQVNAFDALVTPHGLRHILQVVVVHVATPVRIGRDVNVLVLHPLRVEVAGNKLATVAGRSGQQDEGVSGRGHSSKLTPYETPLGGIAVSAGFMIHKPDPRSCGVAVGANQLALLDLSLDRPQ